jgi:hypothetical protein
VELLRLTGVAGLRTAAARGAGWPLPRVAIESCVASLGGTNGRGSRAGDPLDRICASLPTSRSGRLLVDVAAAERAGVSQRVGVALPAAGVETGRDGEYPSRVGCHWSAGARTPRNGFSSTEPEVLAHRASPRDSVGSVSATLALAQQASATKTAQRAIALTTKVPVRVIGRSFREWPAGAGSIGRVGC